MDSTPSERGTRPNSGRQSGRANLRSRGLPGIRFFSSERHPARKRRPTDLVLLALSLVGLGVGLIWKDGTTFSRTFAAAIEAIPGLFGWFWELVADLGVVWALALVVVAVGAKRFALVRDQLLATALAVAGAMVWADDLDALRASFDAAGPPSAFPAVRLAVVAAVVSADVTSGG